MASLQGDKLITNPVYNEFLARDLIDPDTTKKICDRTRDKDIPVYLDENSKIILLESYQATEEYYENNASGDPDDTYFSEHGYYEDDLRRYEQFKMQIEVASSVLDYGCEWGGFLSLANNSCSNISGIELNDNCLRYLNKKFDNSSFYKNIKLIENKLDLITIFHVLEHIPSQVQSLIEIRGALAEGGKLIVEVPHAEDYLIQTIDVPEFRQFTFWSEHLVLHTKKSLEAVLKAAGFKQVEVSGYQRYGFTNHLGWCLDKQPNGQGRYKHIEDSNLDKAYKLAREKSGTTDTLIAIASD